MPKDKYEEQYKKYSGDLAKVSDAFDVSITAAEVRAKVLKLR